ncbi:hypothetical protein HMF7854_02490 [Sphingomonas ginkgonis]|uniref:Phosphodiester glycosidase domain-containing protein n=1 Tax=Sphingomonas ginkgonis TaxID=2315330 RepID=A0A3R9WR53_9SPHN|nr:glycoside hydrolase family 75 protein [Sphingomonas ginkgonis]RST29816.1 hypothetical protein HMF7854_02490 [Sphingomonas ginkgonis]
MTRLAALLAIVLAGATPAAFQAPERPWPRGVALPAGEPVSEDYRHQFDLCDQGGTFLGAESRYTRGCRGDPNRVTALRRLPGGAVGYVSKLAVDLDGSAFACGPNHGRMDQCGTTLMLRDPAGREVPVDADAVPYAVIPDFGPGEADGQFSRLTGVHVGDFGVVIARGRTVPVIVADTGPAAKLGEGSLALHRALGNEQCVTKDSKGVCSRVDNEGDGIDADVTTILFPGSARSDLTPGSIAAVTRREGLRLWSQLARKG